jgi:uncharacterized membrane protein
MGAESGLLRRAKLIDALTFVGVVLVSPASVVFSYLIGVPPDTWLKVWITYVVVFILLAIGICAAGFGFATRLKVRADELTRKRPQEPAANPPPG